MLVCAVPTDDIVRTVSGKLFRRGCPAHILHRGVQFGRAGKVLRRNPQQQTPVDAFLADVRQGTIDVIHTERLDRHGHQRRTAVANLRQERLEEEGEAEGRCQNYNSITLRQDNDFRFLQRKIDGLLTLTSTSC